MSPPQRQADFIWNLVSKNSKKVIFIFSALSAIFIYYTSQLTIDDNLYRKFLPNHPLSIAVDNFNQGLHFVGSIDIIVRKKRGDITTRNSLQIIEKFERELLSMPLSSHLKSYTQLYENIKNEVAPARESKVKSLLNMLYDYGALSSLYKETNNEIRIVLFLKSLNSNGLEKTISQINLIRKNYPEYHIEVNGFAAIRNYINQNIIRSFAKSFLLSIGLIFLLFLVLFQSLKWSLLAMLPNIFPLLTISGLMGIFNITMESNLVIMVSIAIGIAVDDTIHFVVKLKRNLSRGLDSQKAIKDALNSTFYALVTTTSVFIICFPTFFLSDLKLFVQIGVFILISFIMALLADFFLLPAVLLHISRRKNDNI